MCMPLKTVFSRHEGDGVQITDEPTGNLDSKSGGEVMELLCNIRRELDKTLVIITHDSRIAKMADRQFVIVDGILSETGSGVEV